MSGGWEYAPMFNMRFHADERSMDMTRRRRWHRKMVPDRSSINTNLHISSTDDLPMNTDIVFRIQSPVSNIKDDGSTSNKEIKIELNAPRMFLSFKSTSHFF